MASALSDAEGYPAADANSADYAIQASILAEIRKEVFNIKCDWAAEAAARADAFGAIVKPLHAIAYELLATIHNQPLNLSIRARLTAIDFRLAELYRPGTHDPQGYDELPVGLKLLFQTLRRNAVEANYTAWCMAVRDEYEQTHFSKKLRDVVTDKNRLAEEHLRLLESRVGEDGTEDESNDARILEIQEHVFAGDYFTERDREEHKVQMHNIEARQKIDKEIRDYVKELLSDQRYEEAQWAGEFFEQAEKQRVALEAVAAQEKQAKADGMNNMHEGLKQFIWREFYKRMKERMEQATAGQASATPANQAEASTSTAPFDPQPEKLDISTAAIYPDPEKLDWAEEMNMHAAATGQTLSPMPAQGIPLGYDLATGHIDLPANYRPPSYLNSLNWDIDSAVFNRRIFDIENQAFMASQGMPMMGMEQANFVYNQLVYGGMLAQHVLNLITTRLEREEDEMQLARQQWTTEQERAMQETSRIQQQNASAFQMFVQDQISESTIERHYKHFLGKDYARIDPTTSQPVIRRQEFGELYRAELSKMTEEIVRHGATRKTEEERQALYADYCLPNSIRKIWKAAGDNLLRHERDKARYEEAYGRPPPAVGGTLSLKPGQLANQASTVATANSSTAMDNSMPGRGSSTTRFLDPNRYASQLMLITRRPYMQVEEEINPNVADKNRLLYALHEKGPLRNVSGPTASSPSVIGNQQNPLPRQRERIWLGPTFGWRSIHDPPPQGMSIREFNHWTKTPEKHKNLNPLSKPFSPSSLSTSAATGTSSSFSPATSMHPSTVATATAGAFMAGMAVGGGMQTAPMNTTDNGITQHRPNPGPPTTFTHAQLRMPVGNILQHRQRGPLRQQRGPSLGSHVSHAGFGAARTITPSRLGQYAQTVDADIHATTPSATAEVDLNAELTTPNAGIQGSVPETPAGSWHLSPLSTISTISSWGAAAADSNVETGIAASEDDVTSAKPSDSASPGCGPASQMVAHKTPTRAPNRNDGKATAMSSLRSSPSVRSQFHPDSPDSTRQASRMRRKPIASRSEKRKIRDKGRGYEKSSPQNSAVSPLAGGEDRTLASNGAASSSAVKSASKPVPSVQAKKGRKPKQKTIRVKLSSMPSQKTTQDALTTDLSVNIKAGNKLALAKKQASKTLTPAKSAGSTTSVASAPILSDVKSTPPPTASSAPQTVSELPSTPSKFLENAETLKKTPMSGLRPLNMSAAKSPMTAKSPGLSPLAPSFTPSAKASPASVLMKTPSQPVGTQSFSTSPRNSRASLFNMALSQTHKTLSQRSVMSRNATPLRSTFVPAPAARMSTVQREPSGQNVCADITSPANNASRVSKPAAPAMMPSLSAESFGIGSLGPAFPSSMPESAALTTTPVSPDRKILSHEEIASSLHKRSGAVSGFGHIRSGRKLPNKVIASGPVPTSSPSAPKIKRRCVAPNNTPSQASKTPGYSQKEDWLAKSSPGLKLPASRNASMSRGEASTPFGSPANGLETSGVKPRPQGKRYGPPIKPLQQQKSAMNQSAETGKANASSAKVAASTPTQLGKPSATKSMSTGKGKAKSTFAPASSPLEMRRTPLNKGITPRDSRTTDDAFPPSQKRLPAFVRELSSFSSSTPIFLGRIGNEGTSLSGKTSTGLSGLAASKWASPPQVSMPKTPSAASAKPANVNIAKHHAAGDALERTDLWSQSSPVFQHDPSPGPTRLKPVFLNLPSSPDMLKRAPTSSFVSKSFGGNGSGSRHPSHAFGISSAARETPRSSAYAMSRRAKEQAFDQLRKGDLLAKQREQEQRLGAKNIPFAPAIEDPALPALDYSEQGKFLMESLHVPNQDSPMRTEQEPGTCPHGYSRELPTGDDSPSWGPSGSSFVAEFNDSLERHAQDVVAGRATGSPPVHLFGFGVPHGVIHAESGTISIHLGLESRERFPPMLRESGDDTEGPCKDTDTPMPPNFDAYDHETPADALARLRSRIAALQQHGAEPYTEGARRATNEEDGAFGLPDGGLGSRETYSMAPTPAPTYPLPEKPKPKPKSEAQRNADAVIKRVQELEAQQKREKKAGGSST